MFSDVKGAHVEVMANLKDVLNILLKSLDRNVPKIVYIYLFRLFLQT